jgi:hypothetical protein
LKVQQFDLQLFVVLQNPLNQVGHAQIRGPIGRILGLETHTQAAQKNGDQAGGDSFTLRFH